MTRLELNVWVKSLESSVVISGGVCVVRVSVLLDFAKPQSKSQSNQKRERGIWPLGLSYRTTPNSQEKYYVFSPKY